ncbi:MAG: preprotein translocase subunit SecA [Acidobacteria bacterium]|nr:preprotein translocase subunit SecA [Acidobacteriota bacterium]
MLNKILTKIFGSANERRLKQIRPIVEQINELESTIKPLSNDELKAKTPYFKEKLEKGATLDEILPEAFAVVREASRRVTEMRHFDVQLIGGMILHSGAVAEMRTGEGKTLVATLPSYLNALEGKGVHVVTVNDYLAKRDSEWMGKIHRFLGLKVGCIQHDMDDFQRQEAYKADITYGTNNEFGFDYLRDNMKFDLATCVQRPHNFAIVDEVDSILIDEARTPLIISGASEDSTEKYKIANGLIPKLVKDEDYQIDEKAHTAALSEAGVDKAEEFLNVGNLFDPENIEMLHCVSQALKAHTLYQRDKQYIVKDGQVIIVDEFTGRVMPGRRWSDGLHQAVEAKEGVKVERENQTLATITLQNYFRMYKKLSGMTGTAETEAAELGKIYNLDVVIIPTHRAMIRKDFSDVVFRTAEEKWEAVVDEIKEIHQRGQPVLVGTVSVNSSENISKQLKKINVPHNVLNAKPENAAREADIVAQAGRKGAVTIATNMAGRGTDILLGGNPEALARELLKKKEINPDLATEEQFAQELVQAKKITEAEHVEVVSLGGLHILGTERHESRRIDNQLRGRAGRQGDPGSSRFYLSLEDDLMRIFGGDKIKDFMLRIGMEKGVAIESGIVTKRIEAAQKSVEGHNFSIRKHLLEYDDVMNKQRETVYKLRRELLENQKTREFINIAEDFFEDTVDDLVPADGGLEDWNYEGLKVKMNEIFGFETLEFEGRKLEDLTNHELKTKVWPIIKDLYLEKENVATPDFIRHYERMIMLEVIDQQWKDHLLNVDHLKQGIGLVGYGQKDPLVEYKRSTKRLFDTMIERIDEESIRILFHLKFVREEPKEEKNVTPVAPSLSKTPASASQSLSLPSIGKRSQSMNFTFTKASAPSITGEAEEDDAQKPIVNSDPKVGRNDDCPCGSGKKYKKCCGA